MLKELNVNTPVLMSKNLNRLPHNSSEKTNIVAFIGQVLCLMHAFVIVKEDNAGARKHIVVLKLL